MQSCECLFLVFMFGFRNAFVFLATTIGRWNSNISKQKLPVSVLRTNLLDRFLLLCVMMAAQCTGPVLLGNTCPAFIKNYLSTEAMWPNVWCAVFANLCRRASGISVWHSFHSAIWTSLAPILPLAQPSNESMFSFLRNMPTPR